MIHLNKVSKTFGLGTQGLSEISLSVEKGEFVFLVGQTGSGKTTLFRLLIRDLLPSTGEIIIGDFNLISLPHNKIPHLRKKIGIVFQSLKLLMDRTIFENIILPLEVAGVAQEEAGKKVEEIMEKVGMSNHKDKFPVQLSGGELQRTAIARALVLSPEILLADEPTGNLDPKTSKDILSLLIDINNSSTTVVMATHNVELVNSHSKRVVALDKGRLIRDEKKGKYGHT